jgi:hypothetical protein
MKKPIQMSEAGPHPWRIDESKGGKLFIYAAGESQPIALLKSKRRMTRRELATLQLICDAVKCRDANGNTFVLDMQSTYLVPRTKQKARDAQTE